jgi:hypothetical protein
MIYIKKRRDCLSPRNLFLYMSLNGLNFLFFLTAPAELKHDNPTDNNEDPYKLLRSKRNLLKPEQPE